MTISCRVSPSAHAKVRSATMTAQGDGRSSWNEITACRGSTFPTNGPSTIVTSISKGPNPLKRTRPS